MTADEAREDRRLKCIHLFDGECTRNCSSPEQFRPCDGRCPRMRSYDQKHQKQEEINHVTSNNKKTAP